MCVLAMAWADGHTEVFEGFVHGNIVLEKSGGNGFGYDPIFVPHIDLASGKNYMTFAEMEPEKKRKISHRARAFAKLRDYWQQNETELAGKSL